MDIPDFTGGVTMAQLQSRFVNFYQNSYLSLTGKTRVVQPAQAEMLMINAGAYMIYTESVLRIQSACLAMLVPFATYPTLDIIGRDFGVIREPAQPATATVLFTLASGHGALVISAGLRVQSQDGLCTFFLKSAIIVGSTTDTVSGTVVCDTPGVAANGYAIGTVSVILDPQAYLTTAVSTTVTSDGSDVESDAGVRSRIYLAPGAFSCAGPDDAYISLAKSASPLILDVKVNNGGGGLVNLYILVAGGTASGPLLTSVQNACNPKTVRPTSDTVTAYNPTVINYTAQIDIILNGTETDPTGKIAACLAAVKAETDANGKLLGIDTIKSKLEALAYLPGVYKATANLPVADIVVTNTQVGICTSVSVNFIGYNYER